MTGHGTEGCAQSVNGISVACKSISFFVILFVCLFATGIAATYVERFLLLVEQKSGTKIAPYKQSEKKPPATITATRTIYGHWTPSGTLKSLE